MREEGYYWVKWFRGGWAIARWDGSVWRPFDEFYPEDDGAFEQIGPRLTPPTLDCTPPRSPASIVRQIVDVAFSGV